jgi:hypothetical protein
MTTGRTTTAHVDPAVQGNARPQDIQSVVDKIEHIGRAEVPFLSKFESKPKAKQNMHAFLFRKVAESNRKPRAEVSDFAGGTRPSTQRLNNATEIFSHEDWISYAAEDTKTLGETEGSLLERDLVMTHKKSQQDAFLGIGRSIITDAGGGVYNYAPLDGDATLAARMSLIAAPIFRTGAGESPSDASQMAGIFHFIANTDLSQGDINAHNFRDLSSWSEGKLGNILAFDDGNLGKGDWTGNKQVIDKKVVEKLILQLINAGVQPSNGAFDLYAGAELTSAIGDIYGEKRRSQMNDTQVGHKVEVVLTQFGAARINFVPIFNSQNGLDDVVLSGNFSYAGKSYLTNTRKENPETTKTAKFTRYYSDVTLEVNNAYAFVGAVGLKG